MNMEILGNFYGACRMIGKELIVNIEACEAAGDLDGLIAFLIVALERAQEFKRRVDEEDLPTNETFTGVIGE